MDLIMSVLLLAVIAFIVYLVYEFIYIEYQKKQTGKMFRVYLFEKVGKEMVHLGESTALEKNDPELGRYILVKKNKIPIDRLSNEECFIDKRYGKAFFLIKYGEDDYRPMIRLKDQEFFRWETIIRHKVDEDNKPLFEKDGSPLMEEVEVQKPYKEPFGIQQGDREAFRFNMNYHKKMAKRFADNQGFWDKYAQPVTLVIMALILMMSFSYMTTKHSETQMYIADTFSEKADGFIKATQEKGFIEGLLETRERKEAEDNAPPS